MSDTHAQTAEAQADVQRADVQHDKPHIPPGHVETARPIRRLGTRATGPVIAAAAVILAIVVAIAFAVS
jgi:hypothetical protein